MHVEYNGSNTAHLVYHPKLLQADPEAFNFAMKHEINHLQTLKKSNAYAISNLAMSCLLIYALTCFFNPLLTFGLALLYGAVNSLSLKRKKPNAKRIITLLEQVLHKRLKAVFVISVLCKSLTKPSKKMYQRSALLLMHQAMI